MLRRGRRKIRRGIQKLPKLLKNLTILCAFCVLIRVVVGLGADAAAEGFFAVILQDGSAVTRLLSAELGGEKTGGDGDAALTALLSESAALASGRLEVAAWMDGDTEYDDTETTDRPEEGTVPPEETPAPTTTPESSAPDASDIIPTTILGQEGSYYLSSDGVFIKNNTDYEIDIDTLLKEEIEFKIDPKKPQVLIIHTHGSEAFTPAGEDMYTETDPWRTEDMNYNVVKVGDVLTAELEARGIAVLHDRALYDYPSYSGSYTRSMEAIKKYLEEYPDIKIVIDLHRDALMKEDGTIYKTAAAIGEEPCAQVMMIMGSDFSGLNHPKWRENLKLAIRLQAAMNAKYPTLARPITISQYRYNQNATTGSMILEVGCNGNTLREAINAVKYFADSAADVILSLSE